MNHAASKCDKVELRGMEGIEVLRHLDGLLNDPPNDKGGESLRIVGQVAVKDTHLLSFPYPDLILGL